MTALAALLIGLSYALWGADMVRSSGAGPLLRVTRLRVASSALMLLGVSLWILG